MFVGDYGQDNSGKCDENDGNVPNECVREDENDDNYTDEHEGSFFDV